jgi:hypothetical protein
MAESANGRRVAQAAALLKRVRRRSVAGLGSTRWSAHADPLLADGHLRSVPGPARRARRGAARALGLSSGASSSPTCAGRRDRHADRADRGVSQ